MKEITGETKKEEGEARSFISKEREPFVSGTLAAVLSVFIPGLGQILAGKIQRGLLLIGSTATIVGLFTWRVQLLAHREITAWDKFIKALDRRPFFILLILASFIFFWVWNVFDARRQTSKEKRGGFGLFFLVIFLFFAMGWQISEIDPYKALTEFPDAWPPLSKILWPWDAAVTYDTQTVKAGADILVDSEENPPPRPEETPGEPYVYAEPSYGELSQLDEENNIVLGSDITVYGRNFKPDTITQIWWRDTLGNEFRPRQEGEYITVTTDEEGSFSVEMVLPYRLVPPSAKGRHVHRVEARQVSQVGGAKAAEPLRLTIELMVETIFMGMMATIFGIILAIPISFLASRNLMSGSWITIAVYYLTRTVLNIVRAIEPLIWALIAVVWVGLGPFAGIMALTIHSIAALGKLYSEAIENIDPGPIEAIQATGATKLQTIMFAVVPQMIPPFVSFSIYRWDINVRMSTVIGLVGGGGIGFLLVQYIRLLDYRAAGIAVWFIAFTVAVLDYVSSEIRQRFI